MPTQRSSNSKPSSAADTTLLRLLAEEQATPVDQLSRLTGSKLPALRSQAKRLEREGWLISYSFASDKHAWLALTYYGARHFGVPHFRHRPSPLSLSHRRGINQARIELSEEFPEGSWISEGDILRSRGRFEDHPDALFEMGGMRWAIEVELARKNTPRVRRHVEGLLQHYDKVIYFCAEHVLSCVGTAQSAFPAACLEVRRAKAPEWLLPPPKRQVDKQCRATTREVELLGVIVEEGAVAIDQLAELLACDPALLNLELAEMQKHGLLEQGYGFPGFSAWVWCTYRGTKASGMGLPQMTVTSPARLPRRRALMSVRLALTGPQREGRWITRRMLERTEPIEMAVLNRPDRRIAITVQLNAPADATRQAGVIERLASEYDAVWLYVSAEGKSWAKHQLQRPGWKNVEVKALSSQ
jgi:predicted transcriptional regulator